MFAVRGDLSVAIGRGSVAIGRPGKTRWLYKYVDSAECRDDGVYGLLYSMLYLFHARPSIAPRVARDGDFRFRSPGLSVEQS